MQKLNQREKIKVAIYGLGKMGLPLACVFAQKGFSVIGVDIDQRRVNLINRGQNPVLGEPEITILLPRLARAGKIKAQKNGTQAAAQAQILIIIVPTLINKDKTPNLKMILEVARTIGRGLQKGTLVILESTVPPGTTEGLLKNTLERASGLKAGTDFLLAFCPERTNSGSALADIRGRLNPKVVGGINQKSLALASRLYRIINRRGVIPVAHCTVAEMVKIAEMVYRDVKIAYANSLALICQQLKIDAAAVIRAANTDAGCEILNPGPGVGGHCIPVYPYFIFSTVRKGTVLLKAARLINESMPRETVKLIESALVAQGRKLKESNILLLGITYRGDVKETRFSPALSLHQILSQRAHNVFVYDPLFTPGETAALGLKYKSSWRGIDCLVITAEHKQFRRLPWQKIAQEVRTKAIVDAKNLVPVPRLKKLGFTLRRIAFADF